MTQRRILYDVMLYYRDGRKQHLQVDVEKLTQLVRYNGTVFTFRSSAEQPPASLPQYRTRLQIYDELDQTATEIP